MATQREIVRFTNRYCRAYGERLTSLYADCSLLYKLFLNNPLSDFADQEEVRIRAVSDQILRVWSLVQDVDNIWFNVGTNNTLANSIPNDGTPIDDGAPEDGRPVLTGAEVHSFVNIAQQFERWIFDGFFGGPGTGTSRDAMMNTIIVVGGSGNDPLQETQVTTFCANRCKEINDWMEDGSYNILLGFVPNSELHRVTLRGSAG